MKIADLRFGLQALRAGAISEAQLIEAVRLTQQGKHIDFREALKNLPGVDTERLERLPNDDPYGPSAEPAPRRQPTLIDSERIESLRKRRPDPSTATVDGQSTLTDDSSSGGGFDLGWNAEISPGPDAAAADSQQLAPQYRVERLFAEGGLSRVWLAHDRVINRDVAIKQIREDMAGNEQAVRRFRREAQITGQLEHPNIVPVYELSDPASPEELFYTMRLVEGETLREACLNYHQQTRDGHRDRVERLRLLQAFVDVCHAIAFAHARGVIHRDIKPENVVLGRYGEVIVLDWGLARVMTAPADDPEPLAADDEPPNQDRAVSLGDDARGEKTMAGTVLGTPAYMAPEQVDSQWGPVDERTDIYCLGGTLYTILTGQPPRSGDSVGEVIRKVLQESVPRPREVNPRVSKSLEAICLKAMAAERSQRYASAKELADDVQHYLADEPILARQDRIPQKLMRWVRRNRALVTAASVLLATVTIALALGNFFLQQQQAQTLAARNQAQRLAAEMTYNRGLLLCQQGRIAPGLLWMAEALAMSQDQPELEEILRQSMASWATQLTPLTEILEPEEGLISLDFNPNQPLLMTAHGDGKVQFWDLDGRRQDRTLEVGPGLQRVAFGSDGSFLFAIGGGRQVSVWDLASGRQLSQSQPRASAIAVVAACRAANRLLIGYEDGVATLHELVGGQPVGAELVHPTQILAAAFSDSGKLVAVSDASNQVILRDQIGNAIAPPLTHGDWVNSLAFSPDEQLLATASFDHQVRLYRIAEVMDSAAEGDQSPAEGDQSPAQPFMTLPHPGRVHLVMFSPDGQYVLSAAADNAVRLWRAADGREVCAPLRHQGIVTRAVFSPDSRLLSTAGTDNVIRLWSTATGEQALADIPLPSGLVTFDISHEGSRLACLEQNGRITLRDLRPRSDLKTFRQTAALNCVEFDARGETVLLGCSGQGDTILCWKSSQSDGQPTVLPNPGFTFTIKRAPQSNRIASGGTQSWVRIWDLETGQQIEPGIPGSSPINKVAWSHDERYLARVGWDNLLHVHEAATGKEIGPPRSVPLSRAVAFDPTNPHRIAAGGRDGILRLWNSLENQRPDLEIRHDGQVRGIAFSQDGRFIATACQDRFVRIWSSDRGQAIGPPLPHDGAVNDVCFSPDGRWLATACDDGTGRVWNITHRKEILAPIRHSGPVVSITFSPSGIQLATAGQDRSAHIVTIPRPFVQPVERVREMIQALTGMRIDGNGNLEPLPPAAWRKLRTLLARQSTLDGGRGFGLVQENRLE